MIMIMLAVDIIVLRIIMAGMPETRESKGSPSSTGGSVVIVGVTKQYIQDQK